MSKNGVLYFMNAERINLFMKSPESHGGTTFFARDNGGGEIPIFCSAEFEEVVKEIQQVIDTGIISKKTLGVALSKSRANSRLNQ